LSPINVLGGLELIFEATFAILEYFPSTTFPEAGSLALTLVAIFLPLSSIWAAAAVDGASPISQLRSNQYSGSTYSMGHSGRGGLGSTFDRKGSLGPLTPSTVMTTAEHVPVKDGALMMNGNMIGDYEGDFERMGVRIDKAYSVRSGSNTRLRKE
jgi:pheromone alpha factor receptor